MLQPLLEQYYGAEESLEGHMVYSRTKEQHRSMLLCLLMTALIAEDYDLGARQFEALRAALKLTSRDLSNCYRRVSWSWMCKPLASYQDCLAVDGSLGDMCVPGVCPKLSCTRLLPQGLISMPASMSAKIGVD